MVYPKPRYPQPIFMDPNNYEWVPVAGAPGVSEKLLGVFTERRSESSFISLDAGASLTGHGKGVYVVTRGAGTVGDQSLRALTTVYLEAGETVTFTAGEPTELLHFGLPNLAGLRMPVYDQSRPRRGAALASLGVDCRAANSVLLLSTHSVCLHALVFPPAGRVGEGVVWEVALLARIAPPPP